MNVSSVKVEQVKAAYRGSAHACRCGCKGTYRYTKAHQNSAGKARGYEVTDDEVSDKSVAQTLKIVQHQNMFFPVAVEPGLGNEIWMDVQVGNRDYTVYVVE